MNFLRQSKAGHVEKVEISTRARAVYPLIRRLNRRPPRARFSVIVCLRKLRFISRKIAGAPFMGQDRSTERLFSVLFVLSKWTKLGCFT